MKDCISKAHHAGNESNDSPPRICYSCRQTGTRLHTLPNSALIFPTTNDDFLLKLDRRIAKMTVKALFQRLPNTPDQQQLVELLKWIHALSKGHLGELLAACGPNVVHELLVQNPPSPERAIPCFTSYLSGFSRPRLDIPLTVECPPLWQHPSYAMLAGEHATLRVGRDFMQVDTSQTPQALRCDVSTLGTNAVRVQTKVSSALLHTAHWRFGLPDCRLRNIADWISPDQDVLEAIADPRLTALQSAVQLIGRSIGSHRVVLSPLSKEIHYAHDAKSVNAMPGVIRVPASNQPLEIAEALLRADAENLLRTASLALPLINETTSPQALFESDLASTRLKPLVGLLAEAKVATFYACLCGLPLPESRSGDFISRRSEQLERLADCAATAKQLSNLSAFGKRLLEDCEAAQRWASRLRPFIAAADHAVSPKRILLLHNEPTMSADGFRCHVSLAQLGFQRRHTVDCVGPGLNAKNDALPEQPGYSDEPLLFTRGETHRVANNDPSGLKGVIERLLQTHNYDAIISTFSLDVMGWLRAQRFQDLSRKKIIVYDHGESGVFKTHEPSTESPKLCNVSVFTTNAARGPQLCEALKQSGCEAPTLHEHSHSPNPLRDNESRSLGPLPSTSVRDSPIIASFSEAIFQHIDAPNAQKRVLAPPRVELQAGTVRVLLLHENQTTPWDQLRLNELHSTMAAEPDFNVQMLNMSDKASYSSALQAVQNTRPHLVLLDKMPTAANLLRECHHAGTALPRRMVITDYHMLGRVDMLQSEFNRDNARHQLGEWWPSPSITVISPYSHYNLLYHRSGVPFDAIRWLPIPAIQLGPGPGPLPSQCQAIIAGGNHARDLELFTSVLRELPRPIRKHLRYYGHEAPADWREHGIVYQKNVQFDTYFSELQSARFIVSPLREQEYSFGGVSLLDLARTAGKPIITTDLPVIRESMNCAHAILIPPGDADALREAILRCAHDDEFVDHYANATHAQRGKCSTHWLAQTLINLARQA